MTPETAIKRQIKDYLNAKGIFHWYNMQGLGAYKGIPDMFMMVKGNPVALEIKTEKGKLSDHQIEFKKRYEENGGTYLVARGYEDIEKYLDGK